HDQFQLVQALEIRDLRSVAGVRESLEAGLNERRHAAAQHGLLPEQIGFRLLAERGLEHTGPGAADPGGVGEGVGEGLAARVTLPAAAAASAIGRTSRPSARARSHDAPPGRSPTITRTPLSRRLSACACPWLPYPMTATTRSRSRARSASAS